MKAIQFELWPECNVGCRFCYLDNNIRKTDDSIKINNLSRAIKYLERGKFDDYTVVAFIGGEFMQGQLNTPFIKARFFYMMDLVKERIKEGKLQGAWMSAALTQKSDDLHQILEKFKDVTSDKLTGGFWIITSWDTKYRFSRFHKEETWKENLLMIKNDYPNIRINTSIVLTGDLIQKYNAGNFRFQQIMDTYGTQLFFKPPHVIYEHYVDKYDMEKAIPGFFPKRKDFLRFLTIVSNEEECYVWDKLCNIHFRADALLRSKASSFEFREKETKYEVAGSRLLSCGHHHSYGCYIDSDACMLCDKLSMS